MIIIATLQKQIPDMLVIILYNKDKAWKFKQFLLIVTVEIWETRQLWHWK